MLYFGFRITSEIFHGAYACEAGILSAWIASTAWDRHVFRS
jgi:hypothetical protein